MQPYLKLVAFDRPLLGSFIAGQPGRLYREEEVEIIREQAYRKGADDVRSFGDQQLVEFRTEVQALQEGVFRKLMENDVRQLSDLKKALPILVMEVTRRVLAEFEPPVESVVKLCEEALSQVYPERENLELSLSARDAALLENLSTGWIDRYPGLRLKVDPSLSSGDCMVRSRFGVTDARQKTKLAALTESISA